MTVKFHDQHVYFGFNKMFLVSKSVQLLIPKKICNFALIFSLATISVFMVKK